MLIIHNFEYENFNTSLELRYDNGWRDDFIFTFDLMTEENFIRKRKTKENSEISLPAAAVVKSCDCCPCTASL